MKYFLLIFIIAFHHLSAMEEDSDTDLFFSLKTPGNLFNSLDSTPCNRTPVEQSSNSTSAPLQLGSEESDLLLQNNPRDHQSLPQSPSFQKRKGDDNPSPSTSSHQTTHSLNTDTNLSNIPGRMTGNSLITLAKQMILLYQNKQYQDCRPSVNACQTLKSLITSIVEEIAKENLSQAKHLENFFKESTGEMLKEQKKHSNLKRARLNQD